MVDSDVELLRPGYRPVYTGDNSLGNVGSGRELGANLYALYRAGRTELPGVASTYSRMTYTIHFLRDAMEAQFHRPGLGRQVAHDRLLELREEAHVVLRTTCLRMREAGRALAVTADAYAATDQAAADEFSRLLAVNRAEYDGEPVAVPDPPGPRDRPATVRPS
ncbi:MAG: hypothetical protein ACRDT2_03800 [Natronosporangium sp.]